MIDATTQESPAPGEAGMTMIELIVAIAIAVIVTGAAVQLLVTSFQSQPRITARAEQVGTARVAMNRIVNEIRQGVVGSVTAPATEAPSSTLVLDTYVDGACGTSTGSEDPCQVTYSCFDSEDPGAAGSGFCTRVTQGSDGSSSAPRTVVSGISNWAEVFTAIRATSNCPAPDEGPVVTYVSVELDFPNEDGDNSTALSDGAGLRSCL